MSKQNQIFDMQQQSSLFSSFVNKYMFQYSEKYIPICTSVAVFFSSVLIRVLLYHSVSVCSGKRWVLEFCLAKKRKRTKKCIKISVVFPWKNRAPTYISSCFICLINKLSCGSIPKVKANEVRQYRYFNEGTQPHSSCLESLYEEGGAVVSKPRPSHGPFNEQV